NINSKLKLSLLPSEQYPSFLFAYFAYFAVLSPPYSQHPGFLRSPISDLLPPFCVTARVPACNGFCNDLNLEKHQCLCGLLRCNGSRGGRSSIIPLPRQSLHSDETLECKAFQSISKEFKAFQR